MFIVYLTEIKVVEREDIMENIIVKTLVYDK